MNKIFSPVTRIAGTLRVPGDKSISHRGLIVAAMTNGACQIKGLGAGEDVASTMRCLESLGYELSLGGGEATLTGNGWRPRAGTDLDAGNSGTTMRLLSGALAGRPGSYRLTGDASLSRRPMGRIAEPLRLMGGKVSLFPGDLPPVEIEGMPLTGLSYTLPVPSAQVKGSILLAGLQAQGQTRITEVLPSRDHTERMLKWLGAEIEITSGVTLLSSPGALHEHKGFQLDVPGDFSSAAYLLTAACLVGKGQVEVAHVGLNPGRTGLLDILIAMGANLDQTIETTDPEPIGRVTARGAELSAVEIGAELIPRSIDELPLAALAATQATGITVIRDAAELRFKESDRIGALAKGLRTLGASVEDMPDGLIIEGPTSLTGGTVDSEGDHRIALTFAVAAMVASDPISIEGWECTAISYPGFEEDLRKVAS